MHKGESSYFLGFAMVYSKVLSYNKGTRRFYEESFCLRVRYDELGFLSLYGKLKKVHLYLGFLFGPRV